MAVLLLLASFASLLPSLLAEECNCISNLDTEDFSGLKISARKKTYFENEAVVLTCVALIPVENSVCVFDSCDPINWRVDMKTIDATSRHVLLSDSILNVTSTLQIPNVDQSNAGDYNCGLTVGGIDVATRILSLTVYALQITGDYDQLTVGSELMLNCSLNLPLTGSTFQWTDNSGSVAINSAIVELVPVTPTLNGTVYTCTVSSGESMSTASQSITITVKEAAVSSAFIVNPPSYVVDGDRNVELQCTVTLSHHIGPDYSALNITWTHNTNTIHNCSNLQPHGNTQTSNTFTCNLTLATISATSAGVYTCLGEVTGSNVLLSDFLILKVEGLLQSANLHTPENTVLGQASMLTCEVQTSLPVNTSLLSVQWMHRGNMVTTSNSEFVLKQGSTSVYVTELTLNEITVEQSGLYSCLVFLDTNDRQQLTAAEHLTVSFSHVDVLITPSDGLPTQPLLGSNTRLTCSVILHPQLNTSILTIQYKWSSNGVLGSELVLSDLSPADATTYSCQVMVLPADPGQAMIRQISNESAYTLVINMSAPSVKHSPSETRNVFYIGEDVSITCTSKNVTGVVFTWRAINISDRQPVVISNITTHPTPHSSVFKPTVVDTIIVDVICSVTIAGNDNIAAGEASFLVHLIVPVWSVSVSSSASTVLDISHYNSFTVMFGATFHYCFNPRVSITFMLTKDNEPVTDALSIGPVMSPAPGNISQYGFVHQTASSGQSILVYNCTVAFSINGSHITTDSSTTQVTVKGPSLPAAPVVHQPPVTSPTSAPIQWSVPEVTYSPEQYTVYYSTNSSSCPDSDEGYNKSVTVYGLNHTEFYTIRDKQYNVTLNNLHPHTVYCYKVVVNNTVGRNESVPSIFMTNESAPSGPPRNFIIAVTSHSINLTWSPPLPSQRNGIITSYLIECRSEDSIINTTRTSTTSLTITGLEPFTYYTCFLNAATIVDDGPAAVIQNMTAEYVPGVPDMFMTVNTSSKSISFKWSSPLKPNGIIVKYVLQCSGLTEVPNKPNLQLNVSQTTARLSGLHPYTNYSCNITAHTSVGGGPAATTSVTTEQDIPSGPPANFSISIFSRSLNLFWSPPPHLQQNGIIISYTVTCSSQSHNVNKTINSNFVQITDLVPGNNYTCSVYGSTIIGNGPPVVKSIVTEEERPGSFPVAFHANQTTANMITFQWKQPNEPNGIITHYKILCIYTDNNNTQFLKHHAVNGSQTTTTLSGLLPYTNYSCSIIAHTSVGGGPAATTNVTTKQDIPSGFPLNFFISKTSRTLNLSWSPPLFSRRHGIITSYNISCYGKDFHYSQRITKTSRNFTNLRPFTNYTCSVRAATVKGEGPTAMASVVTNEEVPGPPDNFTGISINSISITLSWKAPKEPNGIITNYSIEYFAIGAGRTLQISLTSSQTTTSLSGLLPYTNYSCSITAHTSVGGGPAATTNVTTEQDIPSGLPLNVFISKTSRTLNLSWSPPLFSQRNGVITGYNISCYGKDFQYSQRITQTSGNLTNLRPFTNYTCSVRAATVKGEGPAAMASVVTNEEVPGPPDNFTGISTNSSSITLSWKAPKEQNGIITNYSIQYFAIAAGKTLPISLTSSQTKTTLSGLLPYTNYSCSITAHTSVGGGPAATTSVVTEQDIPSDSIRDLTITSPTESNITLIVSWIPPNEPNGVIISYELDISTSTLHHSVYNISVNIQEYRITTNITDNNLEPLTPYYVKVAAYTVKGRGPYSDIAVNFTQEGVPSDGPNITNIIRQANGSVVVSWEPLSLEEARGFITEYTVTATDQFGLYVRQMPVLPVTVGPHQTKATLCCLHPRHGYRILLSASTKHGESDVKMQVTKPVDKLYTTLLLIASGVCSLVIVVAIFLLLCVFLYCVCTRHKDSQVKLLSRRLKVDVGKYYFKDDSDETIELKVMRDDFDNKDGEVLKAISVEAFPGFVKILHEDRDSSFEDHFQAITRIPKGSCVIAKKAANVPKNRFENICSYDHSCVELPHIDGEEGSDYINATWIDNFRKNRAYIASQGPLDNTVGDFWRMVWEYHVPAIVMLTNLVERSVKKCSCYWPETIDEEIDTGNGLSVRLVEEYTLAEYKIKELIITNDSQKGSTPHRVTHYHFTQWPDHGVPASKLCLISFIKRVRKSHPPEGPPLIVHCSAGVGRTGTFIVLDTMLQRMKIEGDLKIYDFVCQLRKRRTLMVQNIAQYVYIHDALSEYIVCGETSFALTNAHVVLRELSEMDGDKSGFQKQFELLEELSEASVEGDTSEANANMEKNRYTYNLPYNSTRVWLNSGQTDYINASRVHGYKHRGAFLATQAPMKDTVTDFWHMMWETQSKTIIMLCNLEEEGKQTCYQYWPSLTDGTAVYGDMTVKLLSEKQQEEGLIVRKLEITQEGDYINVASTASNIQVTQFHYRCWPENMKPFISGVTDLLDALIKAQVAAGNKPITVMCNDGVGRTGAFICIYSQLERVKMEGVADIFQFIKDSRLQRKGLVRHQDHYIFCYEVIADFSDTMGLYDNFRNVV